MALAEIYNYLNSLNLMDYVKNSRSINHSISSWEIFINRASNAVICGLKHFKYLGSKLWITTEREISSPKVWWSLIIKLGLGYMVLPSLVLTSMT